MKEIKNPKVLVIIPAFNEQECILNTIKKAKNDLNTIDYVVINDCSKDSTEEILSNNGCTYISLPINLGIGGAVQTGYRYAMVNGYDIAIQIDGDGQHDTKYLADVIEPIVSGKADIAIGSRFIDKQGFQSSKARRLGIRILNFLIFLTTGQKVTDCTSGFRAVSGDYIELYAKDYPIDYPEPEAIVMAALKGAKIVEVPVIMKERLAGVSSIRPIHSIYYMLKVSMSIIICRIGNRKLKQ